MLLASPPDSTRYLHALAARVVRARSSASREEEEVAVVVVVVEEEEEEEVVESNIIDTLVITVYGNPRLNS